MIRTYKIHYRVFWKLADDPLLFERETEERAFNAEDALTQVTVRLNHRYAHGKLLRADAERPYEVIKIEPMEATDDDR